MEINSSDEGLTEYDQLPKPIQWLIIGRVHRLTFGAVDLPFRRAAGTQVSRKSKQPNKPK